MSLLEANKSAVNKISLSNSKLEDKFTNLEISKFDKVINSAIDEYKTPNEWLRLIQKPDVT